MSLTARIARNTIIQIVGKGAAVLFGIGAISLLTRSLGQTGFGAYTTVVTFVQFFGTLADLGLYVVSVKKISEHGVDADRMFSNIFTLRIISALVFVVLAPLIVLFFPYPQEVKIGVALVSATNLFVTLTQVLTVVFQKSLAMTRAALAEVAGKAVFFGLIALFLIRGYSLMAMLLAVVLASAAQCLLLLIAARRFVRIRLTYDAPIWREVLRESWPVAISVALNLIYFKADTIILSLFHPQATVGLYGASYKVLEVLVALPAMFAGLILPLVTLHFSRNDWEKFRIVVQKGFDALTMLGLPIVAGAFVLAYPIMTLIAGSEFAASGGILRVLIFAVGIIFVGTMFGYTVVIINQQRAMIKYYLGVAVFALVGYFIFIPPYGVWGAAGMTVATEAAIMFLGYLVVRRATNVRLSLAQFWRAFAASGAMAGIVYTVRSLPLYATVPIGIVVFVVALWAVGGLRRELIQQVIRVR
ncbi:MAG: flippase [Candidatus Kerfeldbacteria bacterium]|nr:flippase [Candidatus Kerfeldbacteria bacterium]